MENFNKNWLAILLIAVIFGTLGFLVGRTTGHGHPRHGHERRIIKKERMSADSLEVKVEVESGGADGEVTIDTIVEDGKQIIIKEVKKVKE
jgi:hypothetical protein